MASQTIERAFFKRDGGDPSSSKSTTTMTTETVLRFRNSIKSTFGQFFAKTVPNPDQDDVEKDCFTQGSVPDIFFVLERENGTTVKVDAER